jgi:D-alanyl-D-alanine carboxypeptidase (penicillin-binding protein 5/6)
MYASLLSVFLMGMLPVAGAPSLDQVTLQGLPISAPLPLTASLTAIDTLQQRLTASGLIVTDLESGQTVVEVNANRRRPMGSLTKLMTALIIAENHAMNEVVTVPKEAQRIGGSVAHLRAGERYTVGALLSALLIASANDAATTLALYHSGSEKAFVEEMNARAQELGLKNTSYANPHGLDAPGEWSSPRDLAWLASFVLRTHSIEARMSSPEASISSIGGRSITLENTHALLHQQSPVIAGKTGTTEAAGQCLLSIVRQGKRDYIVVLLGSHERYADMRIVLSVLAQLFA